MKKLSLFHLFLFLFLADSARAAFLLEPYAGLQFASIELTGNNPDDDYGKIVGPGLGARVGFQAGGLMLGPDFFFYSNELNIEDNSREADYDVEGKEWGIFAGVELPMLLRGWGGYIFHTEVEEKTAGDDKGTWEGQGFKVGLGLTMLPFLSLNLEYKWLNYDEWESQTGSSSHNAAKNGTEWDDRVLLFSVSLPLSVGK